MNKNNIKRRHSKSLTLTKSYKPKSNNTYVDGGVFDYNGSEKGLGWNAESKKVAKDAFSGGNLGGSISSITGAAGNMVDAFKKNASIADTTDIESQIDNVENTSFEESISDDDALLELYNNRPDLKNDYTMQDVRGVSGGEMAMNTIGAVGSGAAAGAKIGGPFGALAGAAVGLASGLGGIFTGNAKARKKAEELNSEANIANNTFINNFKTAASKANSLENRNEMKSIFAANGGYLNKYNNNMGLKYDLGGTLFTHGGDWSNGVQSINTGDLHENNPYEGVPMGIAPDGKPNLVEEGEVIYNDYVFSNRLSLKEKELEKAKLPKKYKNYTFALAAEKASKESSERPNDPISKRGLEDSLSKLAMIQEEQRAKKGKKGTQQMMAYGGRKYQGDDNIDPFIGSLDQSLEDAELSFLANKSPEIQNGLSEIRGTNNKDKNKKLSTFLRYAPAFGSALGVLHTAFQKPDYENADIIQAEADKLSQDKTQFNPINNKLTYNPLDRNYYLNQLNAQAGATRNAIRNSGANAGQTMANLLAADYNTQNAVGNSLMQMEMYNDQQKKAVEEFNRGTNMFNSQGLYQSDAANAQLAQNRDKMRLGAMSQVAAMREAADQQLEASRSAGLTGLYDNLGNIGRENFIMNQIQSNPRWAAAYKDASGTIAHKSTKHGGMLTKRKRRIK